jgi:hypothetical protein
MRTSQEFYSVPAERGAQPNTTYIHRIIGDTASWTASGDQIYKVPVNGTILRVWSDWKTNGAPAPFLATASDPTTQNFANTIVQYAATQRPEIEDSKIRAWRHRLNYNQDTPNGIILYDFAVGGGSIEMGADSRDAYDTQRLTEFAIVTNTSITPTTGTVDYIRQELQRRTG